MLLTVLPSWGLFHRCNLPHYGGGTPRIGLPALAPVARPRRHGEPDLLRLPAATLTRLPLGGDFQVRLRFQPGVLGDCPNRHHGNEPSDHGHIPSPAAAVRAASVRSHMSCPRSAGGRLATLRCHRHARPPSLGRRSGAAYPGKAKTCARSPRPDSKGRVEACRDNAE